MKVSGSESGSGQLTVRQLAETLLGLPDDGIIKGLDIRSNQMDGASWEVKIEWDQPSGAQVNLRGKLHDGPVIGDSLRRRDDARQAQMRLNQAQFGDH
jgi:hypothetical protein